jgi:hypothetical protein
MPSPDHRSLTKTGVLQVEAVLFRAPGLLTCGIMAVVFAASQNAFGDATIGISDSGSFPA